MNLSNTKEALPFVSGFALQNYASAEIGILEALKYSYQYFYIDLSLKGEEPKKWNKKRINQIITMIDNIKVKPILHGNYKLPLSSDVEELRQTALKYVKKEIDLATKLGAPLILHGGAIVEPRLVVETKKFALEKYLLSLVELKNYADKLGVNLLLENLSNYKNYRPFHYIFTKEDEFEYILNSIDLPLFFDIGHANVGNGDPVSIITKYHHRIAGISISNNDGERDQHFAMNKGTINYDDIISELIRNGWKGIVGFETRGRSPSQSLEDLKEIYNKLMFNVEVNFCVEENNINSSLCFF
jgi:sugar phosphate isomerase/epimerase